MVVGISYVKNFFRPRLVEHVPGSCRVYKSVFGYEKRVEYGIGTSEGKKRVMTFKDLWVRMTNPISSSLRVRKYFLGVPLVTAKKFMISDGNNIITKKSKGYLTEFVDDHYAITYSNAFAKKIMSKKS